MDELVIQNHNFEEAKQAIKEFSEQTTVDLHLNRVNSKKEFGEWLGDALFGGGLGTDHKVTGGELNELTVQIQSHFQDVNETEIKLIKQFGEVYNALEALDKDYIQAILIAIKATEKTSEGIAETQEQIKKIVEDQKKTLEVLKKFKQKLDGYEHLKDVDALWESNEEHTQQIEDIQKQNEETHNLIQHNKELVDQALATEKEKGDTVLQQLNKKIQYAYWFAGGSMALALIELLVILLG